MTKYAILTDLNRCVGCMSCMVSCKAINDVPIGNYWNKMLRIGPYKRADYKTPNDVDMYYLCVQCQHCENPKCVEVCPTGASHKLEDGTVQIDKSKSAPWPARMVFAISTRSSVSLRSAPCASS